MLVILLLYCSYDSCVASVQSYSGLGFIFTSNDDYSGIDLDSGGNHDSQLVIFNSFDSYSEISPSGKGLHIIVKGVVPSGKRDKDKKVEVYSSGRFFKMTGNVYNFKPIAERQGLLTQRWEQLGGKVQQEIIPTNDGNETYIMTKKLLNKLRMQHLMGINLIQLWIRKNGTGIYPSQSEADFALLLILSLFIPRTELRLVEYSV